MTGVTSMTKMTRAQADDFIKALKSISEPEQKKGKLELKPKG